MSSSGRLVVGVMCVLVAAAALWAKGIDSSRASGQPQVKRSTYQYVGVEQTMARIDLETGKIEVLSRAGEPRASLLTNDARPWEWRSVPVRERPRRGEDADEQRGDRESSGGPVGP